MSIYSGFATRQLETQYNKAIIVSVYVMQKALAQNVDLLSDKDIRQLRSSYLKMQSLEEHKHLEPKFSNALKHLREKLGFDNDQVIEVDKELSSSSDSAPEPKKNKPKRGNAEPLSSYKVPPFDFPQLQAAKKQRSPISIKTKKQFN
jgi:hypothetical protein